MVKFLFIKFRYLHEVKFKKKKPLKFLRETETDYAVKVELLQMTINHAFMEVISSSIEVCVNNNGSWMASKTPDCAFCSCKLV